MVFRILAQLRRKASGIRVAGSRRCPHRSSMAHLHAESLEERCLLSTDPVLQFNAAVLNAIRADRPSLGFLTRDLAIVHAAIYDAVNAVDQTSAPYLVQVDAPPDASPEAAAAAAGLFTGAALFPTDAALFQAAYRASLADVPDGPGKDDGIAVGRYVAEQTLINRIPDGANAVVDYTPGNNPGDWRPTLPNFAPAQTPQWPLVTPFALDGGSQFRPPAPPDLTSAEYTAAYKEVKRFGAVDSKVRTPEQTEIARFWEGKAGTANFPGYWNEIAQSVATSQGNTLDQDARLFAELNVSIADAVIGHFDAKYTYNRWRPITAIQLAAETGNPDTKPDRDWMPLLNTPPNPSYLSGHATVGGAASTILADFFGTDNISFDLTSDDLPGVTHSFDSFSAAATETDNSVVWGGLHFRYDVTAGQALGQSVAGFVDQNFFQPVPSAGRQHAQPLSDLRALAVQAVGRLFGVADPLAAHTAQAGRERLPDEPAPSPTADAGKSGSPQDSTATELHGAPAAGDPFVELASGSEILWLA